MSAVPESSAVSAVLRRSLMSSGAGWASAVLAGVTAVAVISSESGSTAVWPL